MPRFALILSAYAEVQLFDAAEWYELDYAGRGVRFRTAVSDTLDLTESNPYLGEVYRGPIRKKRVLGWPYSILYRVEAQAVVVLYVQHGKRSDPEV